MGQGDSKVSFESFGAEKNSLKLLCSLDEDMLSNLVRLSGSSEGNKIVAVPTEVAEKLCLKFERCVGLRDSKGGVYCCDLEVVDGKYHLTKGWVDFLRSVGAVMGDCMVFDVKGADETVVWFFRGDGKFGTCDEDGSEGRNLGVEIGNSNGYVTPAQGATNVGCAIDAAERNEGSSTDVGENNEELLASWRERFFLGANVELEDWMIHYVASGMGWELPDVKIYVGRVERSSIANNRMRLPRGYTSNNVLPLLRSRTETFVLQLKYDEEMCVKFSIAKDGRATFTKGWSAFALENQIGPGSLLAFIFGRKETELDIEIDVLKRTT